MNDPLAVSVRLSPPLSCSTTVPAPDRPDRVPPTEYVGVPANPPAQLSAWAVPLIMIPGAPPVKLVSVTEIFCTPLSRNEIVDPTAFSCNCDPAGNAATLTDDPS